ncbi:hypothetical protein F5141DRAFT_1218457 [Pisolithus sp. B1]|nr:hypothetical protein F5141DRAFT_1218457 [Pisolithus sp. B1]
MPLGLAIQDRVARMSERRSNDVGTSEEEDAIAILALVGSRERRCLQSGESLRARWRGLERSERLAELRDRVSERIEGKHLGASNGAGQEEGDGIGCSVGKLIASRKQGGLSMSNEPLVIEQGVHVLTELTPGSLHGMTVNTTSLSDDPLGLRAGAYGPGISVLVDAQSAAGGAIEIVGSSSVEDGEACHGRDDGLFVFIKAELGEIIGSGRDGDESGVSKDGGRPKAQRFGDLFTGAQEDLVDAKGEARRH